MKIIQCYDKLNKNGGAQTIVVRLHELFLSKNIETFIVGMHEYENTVIKSDVSKCYYRKFNFSVLKILKNSIFLSHSRKMTTLFVILNFVFRLKMTIVHIAHTIHDDKKIFTIFPKNIIAVSNSVKLNLINYFNIDESRIQVIYNGIKDQKRNFTKLNSFNTDQIKILFIGRIEELKQQVLVVKKLKNCLNNNIKIDFVGDGDQVEELINEIRNQTTENFRYLGYSNNILEMIPNYHFVMLFSKKEGLGLTLIESCMLGVPIITRGTSGCEACAEICINDFNGFIVNNFEDLCYKLNDLSNLSKESYWTLCLNARRQYEENFRIETMYEHYMSYLKRINKCAE
jgi:glycosyltransferase involved in cell wall biosynthesis